MARAEAVTTFALAFALAACHRAEEPLPRVPHEDAPETPPVLFERPPVDEIAWLDSPAEARARAADEKKPLLVFVRAGWSSPSVTMDQTIWKDARVLRESVRFVALRIDLTHDIAKIPDAIAHDFGVESLPTTLVIASDGTVVGRYAAGVARAADVAEAMRRAR